MLTKVERVLDERVRPKLASHGGGVDAVGLQDGILTIRLTGCCSGCPASQMTINELVKAEVMAALPEIKDVQVDSQISPDMLEFAKRLLRRDS